MPRHALEYPQESRNTVIRKGKDRGNAEEPNTPIPPDISSEN